MNDAVGVWCGICAYSQLSSLEEEDEDENENEEEDEDESLQAPCFVIIDKLAYGGKHFEVTFGGPASKMARSN